MGPAKIVRMVAAAAAIVFAFYTTFEYEGLLLALLGLGIGYFVEADRRTLYLVATVALSMAAINSGLGDIPKAGDYITGIFENISAILNAGALVVVGTIIYERITE